LNQAIAQDSPVSPTASLQLIELDRDYRIELAACEPQITDPVSMQIDERGRMWVVEMRDYPVEDETPKSRVVRLEDRDADGFYESSHVFADKLRFATGIQPWEDGALVTVHGQLLMLRDTDGDGSADKREVWLDGFSTGNPQLRANHPMFGPDGWLYIASGLRGGKVESHLPFATTARSALDITGSDMRINLWTGEMEAIAGPSQFGLSFDRLGNRYVVSNRQPCMQIVSDRDSIGRSPLAGLASPTVEVSPGDAASKVFPLVKAWTTSNLHAGQFTAACGMLVTHSQHFPDNAWGHVLTCEPTGGLVQMRSFAHVDGRGKVLGAHSSPEWLASRDPWFRPVDTYEGPGGAIFVVDMYRAVIEHPEWVPAELKKRPDERFGDAHGRIYRITRNNTAPPSHEDRVLTGSLSDSPHDRAEVSRWLGHQNAWNRNIAIKTIVQATYRSGKQDWIETLRTFVPKQIVQGKATSNASLLLASLGGLHGATIESLLQSGDAEWRTIAWRSLLLPHQDWKGQWTTRAFKDFINPDITNEELRDIAWFFASQDQGDSQTRLSPEIIDPIAIQLLKHANDPHVWMATAAALRAQLPTLVMSVTSERVAESAITIDAQGMNALSKLTAKAALQMDSSEISDTIQRCAIACQNQAPTSVHRCVWAVLDGMVKSKQANSSDLAKVETLVHIAIGSTDSPVQFTAIGMLGALTSPSSQKLAFTLLEHEEPKIRKLAVAACSNHDTPEFTDWLLARFPTALPDIRQDLFIALRSKPGRLQRLIEQLETGAISMKAFDASQIQNLKGVKEESLTPRLAKLLTASINQNRQRVIDDYKRQMESITVNPANHRGKVVFEKNCAACHRLDQLGTSVGPDISDSRTQSFDNLLISILDPNRTIDANYFRFLARTEDGKIVEGVLKDANSQTVTLQNQNGAFVLQRSEIEELKSSGTSLMPEGIEVQIPVQDMADLLWYIKNWRYAAENVPANAQLPR
jgi:putative membrane-bound dehydrogenase-like protein